MRPPPSLGVALRVVEGEAAVPRWSGNSKELRFKASDALGVAYLDEAGAAWAKTGDTMTRESLASVTGDWKLEVFDVRPDGREFLLQLSDTDNGFLTLMFNWPSLRERPSVDR